MRAVNKIIVVLFSAVLLVGSCKENEPKIDTKLLEGDWIECTTAVDTTDGSYNTPLWFRLGGWSLNNSCGSALPSYKLESDTLSVYTFKGRKWRFQPSKYEWIKLCRIEYVTTDTLSVKMLRSNFKRKFYNSRKQYDPSIELKKITFASAGCYGSCPVMKIEVSRDSVFYYGDHFVDKLGDFIGSTPKGLFSLLQEKVRCIKVDSLSYKFGEAPIDSWYHELTIEYNDTVVKGCCQIQSDPALFMLIQRLIEVPLVVELTPATKRHKYDTSVMIGDEIKTPEPFKAPH